MKVIMVFISFLLLNSLWAFTDVPAGNVSGVFNLSGSPYRINGDITIPNGQTLTVNPGVQVLFSGAYRLKVDGRLVAVGTQADSIRFNITGSATTWKGIRFCHTAATNDSSLIDYCVLENGNASGGSTDIDNAGGALYSQLFSKLRIAHSRFSNNYSVSGGGAAYFDQCDIVIRNCIFSYNNTPAHGGGLQTVTATEPYQSNRIRIYDSTFNHNYGSWGGGVFIAGSTGSVVDNCHFDGDASYEGGGIMMHSSEDLLVTHCVITRCISNHIGGGINCTYGNATLSFNSISGCYFSNGWDNPSGMGIGIQYGGPYLVYNNIIYNNLAENTFAAHAGGVRLADCSYELVNNAIYNNGASQDAGVLASSWTTGNKIWNNTITNNACAYIGGLRVEGYADIRNNIIWGNSPAIQIRIQTDGTNQIWMFNDIENGLSSFEISDSPNWNAATQYMSNIAMNPLFAAPTAGAGVSYDGASSSWQIPAGSPCRNAGDPDLHMGMYSTDCLGNPRVDECRIDIGAYEYQNPLQPPRPVQVSRAGGNVVLLWSPVTLADNYAVYVSDNPDYGFMLLDNAPSHFVHNGAQIQRPLHIEMDKKYM